MYPANEMVTAIGGETRLVSGTRCLRLSFQTGDGFVRHFLLDGAACDSLHEQLGGSIGAFATHFDTPDARHEAASRVASTIAAPSPEELEFLWDDCKTTNRVLSPGTNSNYIILSFCLSSDYSIRLALDEAAKAQLETLIAYGPRSR